MFCFEGSQCETYLAQEMFCLDCSNYETYLGELQFFGKSGKQFCLAESKWVLF